VTDECKYFHCQFKTRFFPNDPWSSDSNYGQTLGEKNSYVRLDERQCRSLGGAACAPYSARNRKKVVEGNPPSEVVPKRTKMIWPKEVSRNRLILFLPLQNPPLLSVPSIIGMTSLFDSYPKV
jgi:hypothetical protein